MLFRTDAPFTHGPFQSFICRACAARSTLGNAANGFSRAVGPQRCVRFLGTGLEGCAISLPLGEKPRPAFDPYLFVVDRTLRIFRYRQGVSFNGEIRFDGAYSG